MQRGDTITRVKLSDREIMPVEIRKSYFANFTVLTNPECTANCATKTITYESGTMAFVIGELAGHGREAGRERRCQLLAAGAAGRGAKASWRQYPGRWVFRSARGSARTTAEHGASKQQCEQGSRSSSQGTAAAAAAQRAAAACRR